MLKVSTGFSQFWPTLGVVVGYFLSFSFYALSLKLLPLSVVYTIWSGLGTVLTIFIGYWIWSEPISFLKGFGIILIIIGVVMLSIEDSSIANDLKEEY